VCAADDTQYIVFVTVPGVLEPNPRHQSRSGAAQDPVRETSTGMYPRPDINLRDHGWVETGLRLYTTISTSLAAIEYWSSDCIMT
jgi:hypothetical protein